MRKLPKVVASTAVGKSVQLKIWRNKKEITKRLTLGRLESSAEFKEKKASTPKKSKEFIIDTLKITVRDLNLTDKQNRKLNNNLKGSVILEIGNRSPLARQLSVNDIIIEVQKKPVISSATLDNMIKDIVAKKNQTLLLTIINSSNQRRYLGVKIR